MIISKVFEIKVRKIEFLSSLYEKGDKKIHQMAHSAFLKYERYQKIIRIFIFDFVPAYFYELLVKTKDFVAKKYYETGSSFRGRRMLKSTGSVSFFLERLSEEKQKN